MIHTLSSVSDSREAFQLQVVVWMSQDSVLTPLMGGEGMTAHVL